MNLVCKPIFQGIMAYWDGNKNAASYTIKLFINDRVISQRINERTELYCSFTGLAAIDGITTTLSSIVSGSGIVRPSVGFGGRPIHSGFDYYVQVEVEDKNGKIIDETEKVKCSVKSF